MAALYADDTKAYRSIKGVEDCISLQNTLTNMNAWAMRNNIRFNSSKCKVLSVCQFSVLLTGCTNPLSENTKNDRQQSSL